MSPERSSPGGRPHPGPPPVALLVAAGGAVGALLRWLLEGALPAQPGTWPWATFLTNVSGSFALGAVVAVATATASPWLRPLLGTGVLGGFTTWSTYTLQVHDLGARSAPTAVLYAVSSVVVGVGAAYAGVLAVRSAGFRDGPDPVERD